MRAPSVGVDRLLLGSQAFADDIAFNANIGAWNTSRVTTLYAVCAAFPARATKVGRARRVVDAARAVVRGRTTDARSHVRAETCGHAHARVSTCVGMAARSRDGLHVCMYMYVYVCI